MYRHVCVIEKILEFLASVLIVLIVECFILIGGAVSGGSGDDEALSKGAGGKAPYSFHKKCLHCFSTFVLQFAPLANNSISRTGRGARGWEGVVWNR